MSTAEHPFTLNPHRTLFALALPVLISLIAEPLTGLVDTFFIARLGAGSLAALGVAAALLSSAFWIFNFLGIGTQTEVARLQGSSQRARAAEASGTAILLALLIGTALALACWPWLDAAAGWMGADAEIAADTVTYLKLRLLGAPATLVMFAAFGALRGLQDMRTPLRIALASNALNVQPVIPLAGGLFIIQGVAECMRCYLAIKTNKWLPRLEDARETEDLLKGQATGLDV